MEAEPTRSSETVVPYITTRRHNPEDHDLNHHHQNLKSLIIYVRLSKAMHVVGLLHFLVGLYRFRYR